MYYIICNRYIGISVNKHVPVSTVTYQREERGKTVDTSKIPVCFFPSYIVLSPVRFTCSLATD